MNAKDVIQQRSSDQIAADGEQPKSDSGRSNGSGDGLGGSDAVGKDGGPALERVEARGKPERKMAVLGRGRSVIVVGHNQTISSWITDLSLALSHARCAQNQGLTLDGLLHLLRRMKQE